MNKIKEQRIRRGMTQQQFATLTGIPFRTIQSWEEGQRKCPDYVEYLLLEYLSRDNGEWKEVIINGLGYHYECSICGGRWMMDSQEHICKRTPYCPHCGSKMA